jgi:hypothetical protein
MKTIVALFEDRSAAKRAIRELVVRGITHDRISLVSPADESEARSTRLHLDDDLEHLHEAGAQPAADTATTVGIGSMILSAAFLTLPAIGPVLAAGPLLAGIAASGARASDEDLSPSLHRSGVPPQQAQRYSEAVRRGGALVVVATADDDMDDVASTLARHSPIAA